MLKYILLSFISNVIRCVTWEFERNNIQNYQSHFDEKTFELDLKKGLDEENLQMLIDLLNKENIIESAELGFKKNSYSEHEKLREELVNFPTEFSPRSKKYLSPVLIFKDNNDLIKKDQLCFIRMIFRISKILANNGEKLSVLKEYIDTICTREDLYRNESQRFSDFKNLTMLYHACELYLPSIETFSFETILKCVIIYLIKDQDDILETDLEAFIENDGLDLSNVDTKISTALKKITLSLDAIDKKIFKFKEYKFMTYLY